MFFAPDMQVTLLTSDPPRTSSLAVWPAQALPERSRAHRAVKKLFLDGELREVDVNVVPIREVIDELVTLEGRTNVTDSVRAWSLAAKLTIDLISRGRIRPTASASGVASWQVGPLDPADVVRREQLCAALPPTAHCSPIDESESMVLSPDAAVTEFSNAIADTFVRTSAASVVVEDVAFGSDAPFTPSTATDQDADGGALAQDVREWLLKSDTPRSNVRTALQIEAPVDDGAFSAQVWLHPADDPSTRATLESLWQHTHADPHFRSDPELSALRTLHAARQVWPAAGRLLDRSIPGRMDLTDDDLASLLGPASGDLASVSISVEWPDDVAAPIELVPLIAPVLERDIANDDDFDVLFDGLDPGLGDDGSEQFIGTGALARQSEMRWIAMLNGEPLTEAEIEELHRLDRPLARVRDRWVRIDPADLARLGTTEELSSGAALAAALSGTVVHDGRSYRAEVRGPIAALAERLLALESSAAPSADDLNGTLREYQERGLAWLHEMTQLGLGGVLADDMGLGKTIQVLALHLSMADEQPGPTLVVCPATLIGNWEREAATFAPTVPIRRFHGAERSLDDVASNEIVVVTYGVIRRDADTLSEVAWGLVVADEAQVVKNPLSLTAKELRRIPTRTRFALTGTPVENRLADLWALLDWTTPGLLGPLARFRRDIAIPIERNQDDAVAGAFARLIAPFVLRRRKTDPSIAPELPPKTETDQIVELSTEQSALYKSVADEILADIGVAEGIARRGLVLRLLTALKQICNHPAHFLADGGELRGRSGKLTAVDELLEVIVSEGDSTLVFTQYVEMGHLLERHFQDNGMTTLFLHGKVPVVKRQPMIDEFQAGGIDVFVISLKAGGTGLNLTQATHVIHYDRWWNPAVEDQASDRAWRIGQDRPVQVHRMMCGGTLEDRIGAVLESKRQLAEAVVGGGEAWISELSNTELADLVSLAGGSA